MEMNTNSVIVTVTILSIGKMRSENRIPVHTATPPPPPPKRSRSYQKAKYYVERVKESLTTRVSKMICSIFLMILFVIGLIFFILWLSLRPHRPRFYVDQFTIPAIAQSPGAAPETATIFYNITDRNSNQNIAIYYDSIQLTVFYNDQTLGTSPVLFPFLQRPKNTTLISGQLGGDAMSITSDTWRRLLSDRSDGRVVFRVEVRSGIKFQISTWDSRTHIMHATCDVGVGADGSMLPEYRNRRCPQYFS